MHTMREKDCKCGACLEHSVLRVHKDQILRCAIALQDYIQIIQKMLSNALIEHTARQFDYSRSIKKQCKKRK